MEYNGYERYAKLTAYDSDGNVAYRNEDGQRIRFEISKSVKPAPNACNVCVYGMDREDSEKVLTHGGRIELNAGLHKDAGLLFRGDIIDGFFSDGDNPHLTVIALDGDAFCNSYLSLSVGAGETLLGLVKRSVVACSAPVGIGRISPMAGQIRLPRGCALFGATSDVMDSVSKALNAAWYVNDGLLYMLTDADMQNGSNFIVNTDDDLVGVPVVDSWSVSFSHHIDSRVVLGSTVSFDKSNIVRGSFRIMSIDVFGDTHDGDWKMNILALRQEGDSPTMTALTQNIWR